MLCAAPRVAPPTAACDAFATFVWLCSTTPVPLRVRRAAWRPQLMYANNNRYEGEWKDDRRDGAGTFFHADGSRYEGQWSQGRKDGKGTLFFANGDSYQGNWAEGQLSGPGFLTLNSESPWNMPDL
jgi:hypothetical protein